MYPFILLIFTLAAYANSFGGAFVFDDQHHIEENAAIRHSWPSWEVLRGTERPVVQYSFAVNYALGRLNSWGYHAVNIVFHFFSGWILLEIMRRTLKRSGFEEQRDGPVEWLAFAMASLWLVHPVQTESVTYIVQRSESLMGFFYLLTLYCVIRSAEGGHAGAWKAGAVISCALGMGSKAVMVTAPVLAIVYDRIFLARSWPKVIRQRKGLYLGLLACWGILGVLLAPLLHLQNLTAGFGLPGLRAFDYWLSQGGVILHYLRLILWPHPLVIDYAWPVASQWREGMPAWMIVGALIGTFLFALRRFPAAGFAGISFFLLLLPVILVPLADLAAEHRLYLPLAPFLALVIVGMHMILKILLPSRPFRIGVEVFFFLIIAGLSITLTIQRNSHYQTELKLWQDTVLNRPANPRAHFGFANALMKESRLHEAVAEFREALRLKPDYAKAHTNLGLALAQQGKVSEAIEHYQEAIRLMPKDIQARSNLGISLVEQGKIDEAIRYYQEALQIQPQDAEIFNNLGLAFVAQKKIQEAIGFYRKALGQRPDYADAFNNLGNAYAEQGNPAEAAWQYQQAIKFRPNFAEAYNNLGIVKARQGKIDEAMTHFQAAIRLKPGYAPTYNNLGIAFGRRGEWKKAIEQYQKALEIKPDFHEAAANLQDARAQFFTDRKTSTDDPQYPLSPAG